MLPGFQQAITSSSNGTQNCHGRFGQRALYVDEFCRHLADQPGDMDGSRLRGGWQQTFCGRTERRGF